MSDFSFLVGMQLSENEISKIVADSCIQVHQQLGPGLFESVYQTCLAYELESVGLKIEREVALPICYKGLIVQDAFRIDILINDKVILELKAVTELLPIHSIQLSTYLKLSDKKLGLLINFGGVRVMDGFKRIVNDL